MNNIFGTIYTWIDTRIAAAPDAEWLVGLIFLLVLYSMLSTAIRVMRWQFINIMTPIMSSLASIAAFLILSVECLVTQVFRLARSRPPWLSFYVGETVATYLPSWQHGVKDAAWSVQKWRPKRLTTVAALLVSMAWWNGVNCSSLDSQRVCTGPPSAWARSLNDLFTPWFALHITSDSDRTGLELKVRTQITIGRT